MNVTETQQNYTNYQTQNNDSKTISKESFLSTLENFKTYKTENTVKTEVNEEEYNEKYQLGLLRYNTMGSTDDDIFENTIFEKDQNAKNEFIEYLSNMSLKDYMQLSINLFSTFTDMALVQDKNGNIIQQEGSSRKDAAKELASIQSTKNYFQDEINRLEESTLGEDAFEIIDLLTDVLNFFKDYQSKEQENQYQVLGNQN